MKGDFSKWKFDPKNNFSGVLHQQGRILLDSDWNAQTQITRHWQDQAGRDVIGPGVAAVPANAPDSFRVQSALVDSSERIELTITPGRVWADGLLTCLPGEEPDLTADVSRIATYLQPPIQDPAAEESTIGDGIRDAVILEVWRESLNGFQLPDILIEPALGGPDTTERMHTAMALRLFRLGEEETCKNIKDRLQDDFSQKGKLKASLQPPQVIAGDCPVVEGGGYTGFEHNLYRIEIAQVDSGAAMFKWSQFNGGLVGRGIFDATPGSEKVQITANLQAIITAGLSEFYLEAVAYNEALGHWQVTYGAEVTLNSDNEIELAATPTFGSIPAATDPVFFRLWNGIRDISDFPVAADPVELRDGIRLEFQAPAGSNYTPGDYWTFSVRAGEINNPQVLIDTEPPQGIHYHRVPLAELNWDSDKNISFAQGQIEDCRDVFRPLTDLQGCCTFSVGDGIRSHGDFDSIEEAITHLPPRGGKICVLAGKHAANVTIESRQNIQISGCGEHTIVHPHAEQTGEPIFQIRSSQKIQLDHMTLLAMAGTAIKLEDPPETENASRQITIDHNRILACVQAICILVKNEIAGNNDIWIAYNVIGMLDKEEGKAAIFCLADDVLIERNRIVVVPPVDPDNPDDPRRPDEPRIPVFDPCADPARFFVGEFSVFAFVLSTFQYITSVILSVRIDYLTQGGIQIGGGSEQVKIIGNEIIGGWGNGITLGHLPAENERESGGRSIIFSKVQPGARLTALQRNFVSTLYEVCIEENSIQNMGLSGVGVAAFLSLENIGLMVTVEDLIIYRNHISECALQMPPEIPNEMVYEVGFGGIALSDCRNVIIRENHIENNGMSHIDPVSGVFILHGENIDVSDNRILNNGPYLPQANFPVKRGLRAGIYIGMSVGRKAAEIVEEARSKQFIHEDGIPAAKVHDNIVTQPLGQALIIFAMGNVSIVNNQLSSQGIDAGALLSLLGGTVLIVNLGVAMELVGLKSLHSQKNYPNNNPQTGESVQSRNGKFTLARKNLLTALFLPGGKVMFQDNQTSLDLRQPELRFGLSSQLIISLDDISFSGNQSSCSFFIDILLANTVLFAPTVRTSDNRFQEGLIFAFFSLFSLGMMNTCTNNQATHCIAAYAPPNYRIDTGNLILAQSVICKRINEILSG